MRWLLILAAVGACDGALHRMQDHEDRADVAAPSGVVAWDDSGGGACSGAGSADDAGSAVTRVMIERGEDRFDRVCAACHGVLGDGDSVVARAMIGRRPGSLVDEAAVRMDDARVLRAMVLGYGAMPAVADVLPARDRFAVLQFMRALQHRDVALDQLPAAEHAEAARWLP